MDIFTPTMQRAALLPLVPALSCVPAALRRDECGDWRIRGSAGHIYAGPDGFMIIAEAGSKRIWSSTKHRLGFAELQRDGDEEGSFTLDRLPTPVEAAEVRKSLGIRKSPDLTNQQRAALAERMRAMAPPTAPSLDEVNRLADVAAV